MTDKNSLFTQLSTEIANIEQLLANSGEVTESSLANLRGQLEESLAKAKDSLSENQQALIERGKTVLTQAEQFIKEHPYKALAIGAGVGLLLGYLFSKR
ncbi:hypothetical protein VQ643_00955 [Pseudomonas sp. F1_0610]|uniref:DUF883 family protein n=1 Tax=Pseudomonas sp. F1_0610 TaxID=3114284 RepID=UPI0039C232F2